jgi:hypothetical protein
MNESVTVQRSTQGELTAIIVFDSIKERFAGSRGPAEARHVVARSEELDIHLKISTNPTNEGILGQVFARNDTQFINPVRVRLMQNGTALTTTWSDNFGQFQFDELPGGAFSLQIDLPRMTIVSGISIGEQG